MTSTHKFQFETFVDQPEPAEEVPFTPPQPLFTLEEKEAAHQQGYTAGYAQGKQEALTQETFAQEALIQSLLTQIKENLEISFEELEGHKKNVIHQVIHLVRHIFEKLFPILEKHLGTAQVQKLIQDVMATQAPSSLKITVNPQVRNLIQEQLKKIPSPCAVTFEEEGGKELSTCRLEWQDSGVERSVSQIVADIETLLKGFENILEESSKKIESGDEP